MQVLAKQEQLSKCLLRDATQRKEQNNPMLEGVWRGFGA